MLLSTLRPTWLFGFCEALALGLGSLVSLALGSGVCEAEGSSVGAEVAPQFGEKYWQPLKVRVPSTTAVVIKNFFNLAPVVDSVKNWRTALT